MEISEDFRALIKGAGGKVNFRVADTDIDTCHKVPVARSFDENTMLFALTREGKKTIFPLFPTFPHRQTARTLGSEGVPSTGKHVQEAPYDQLS